MNLPISFIYHFLHKLDIPMHKRNVHSRKESVKDVDIWLVLFISVMRSKILQKIMIISITTCMFTWQY